MRFKKSIINSMFLMLQQVIVIVLSFVNRTFVAQRLGMEYLGYTTLFGNIFIWISFAELGFSAISYLLYGALAKNDRTAVSAIVQMFRRGLRLVGITILAVGLLITGLIPYLIKDASAAGILQIYKIYWMQLIAVAIPYFSTHWRLYIQANQEEYICTNLDSIIKIIISVGQFIVLAGGQGIYVYLSVNLLGNVLSAAALEYIGHKKYAGVIIPGTKAMPLRSAGLWKEIKDYIIHRISMLLYNSTDSILISMFCGSVVVAQYGNYTTIYQYTSSLFFTKLFQGIQASLGNFLNVESKENTKRMFSILDTLMYLFACVVCCGYVACFQPFMRWWMGEENTLPVLFLALYICTAYISCDTELLYKYRAVYGHYALDRGWMLGSAVSNLGLSLLLVGSMGVIGIQVGTIVGLLCVAIGRGKVTFIMNPQLSAKEYIKKHGFRGVYFLAQALGVWLLCYYLPVTLPGIFLRGFVAVCVSLLAGGLLFCVSEDARLLPRYLRTKIHLLHRKGGRERE